MSFAAAFLSFGAKKKQGVWPPIYNRVIQNRKAGKYTHVHSHEIYLFFANGSGSGHGINN